MRKRPSYNGIKHVYKLQKSCCACNKPFFDGDEYGADLNNRVILCIDCCEVDAIETKDPYWVSGIYGENENTYMCIDNLESFEGFIGEEVIK